MQIVRYKNDHKEDCIQVFLSNADTYFAEWEREEFENYLTTTASEHPFFVILDTNKVIGCGGYEYLDGAAGLTWGMIDKARHKKSYGKALLTYRMDDIKEKHGEIPIRIDTSQHASGFFKKFGFITINIEKDGYTKGLHKVFMEFRP